VHFAVQNNCFCYVATEMYKLFGADISGKQLEGYWMIPLLALPPHFDE
jgi:hypothetical protein